MTDYQQEFIKYLKKKNLKFTPERKAILDEVFSLHQHFDIDKLYNRLQEKHKDISRATIYRTLPLLVDNGLVREALHCQDKVFYEHIYGHEHHDHLLCIGCGKVIGFSEPKIERLQDEVCKGYGFHALEHRLGLRGYCKECQKKVKYSLLQTNRVSQN